MPLTNNQVTQVARAKMMLQIITGALMMGVIFFLLIVIILSLGEELQWSVGVLELVGVVMGLGGLMAGLMVVPMILSQQIEKLKIEFREAPSKDSSSSEWSDSEVQALLDRNQSFTLARYSLLDGAAFFNLIVFLMGHGVVALVMAGVVLLAMFSIFPRGSHFDRLLDVTNR